MPRISEIVPATRRAFVLLSVLVLVGCTVAPDSVSRNDGIYDPYEVQNRKVHAFNKALDRNLLGPGSKRYARVVPVEVRSGVNNISDNLSMPGVFVNSLLQGDLRGAALATFRFAFNSTVGLGGFIDAASEFKFPEHETDFGQTLAVWGVGEGAYLELPVLGPSTQRGAVGRVVDLFTNPLSYRLESPDSYVSPTTRVLKRVDTRARYSDTVESILYDSADSYAQARLIFLQNRRFELGEVADDTDPYEDPYAQ